MKSISSTLEVVGIHGETMPSREAADSLSSMFSVFCRYIKQFESPTHDAPPQKKQRISRAGSSVSSGADLFTSFDPNCMITVALLALDLDFPGDQEAIIEDGEGSIAQANVPLHIQSLQRSSDTSTLGVSPRMAGEAVQLECRSSKWDEISPHLDRMITLGEYTRTNALRKSAQALPFFELQPPQGPRKHFRLIARMAWKTESSLNALSRTSDRRLRFEHELWCQYLSSSEDARNNETWSIPDFYEIVHTPSKSVPEVSSLKRLIGSCDLFPFQNRTVQWALKREGVTIAADGQIQSSMAAGALSREMPVSFRSAADAEGRPCHISALRGLVTIVPTSLIPDGGRDLLGGVLAEEMGLGKTVELISLMNTHKRNGTLPSEATGTEPRKMIHDLYTDTKVFEGGGTLVITPQSILDQWFTELQMHSPNLRLHHFRGVSSFKNSEASDDEVVENLLEYDVVITTYAVLAREIHYARPPPERNLRGVKKYEPRKSPLVQISWWRVCLDEAQMVENGVSSAATVARLIPRINAWAISGTPLRRDVQDLLGLLIFLRYEPFCNSKKLWQKAGKDILKEVFGQIALRHTKSNVRDELRLPYQLRYVIMQPFTAIEEANYKDLFRQMCDELDMSLEGTPLTDEPDRNPAATAEKMRQWLRRLRQTCVHPLVGGRNRRALGRGARPLRTVDEVLEVMIDQNDVILRNEERKLIAARVTQGHIIGNNRAEVERGHGALKIYQAALLEANRIVDECAQELAAELEKSGAGPPHSDDLQDLDYSDSSEAQQDDERNPRLSRVRIALKSAREVQHLCNFFTATAYYQIKSEEAITLKDSEKFHELEEQETKYYDAAKAIRHQLLRGTRRRAERTMETVKRKGDGDVIHTIALLDGDSGGIENRKLLDQMDDVFEWLNKQRQLIHEWRAKVLEILVSPLVDEDADGKEITGEEYESSTKTQDELYVYLTSLRALVADRNFLLSGQSNILIEHEVKSAMQQAKWGEGHAPELLLQCMEKRRPLAPAKDSPTFRGVIAQARSTANALAWQRDGGRQRAGAELEIVERQLKKCAPILSDQNQELVNLEKEMEAFRACMNQRVEFYRQLQHISDTVAPWKEEMDEVLNTKALDDARKAAETAENRLKTYKTKKRFLDHLRLDAKDETTRTCIICQDTYVSGVLTVCGHKFCRECITLWWHESKRTCPVCKQTIKPDDCHDITYKPKEIRAVEESAQASSTERDELRESTLDNINTTIYHRLGRDQVNEINSVDLNAGGAGGYGTKIDNMIRHLIHMRSSEPGSKTIVFSQFSQFLETLGSALERNKIEYASIAKAGGIARFKQVPSVRVFLLDAKSDSSGLNLVHASNVFLSEPLINPAIELQAIARVHRIGQTRTTKVFMYLIEGSVEESIYEISVSRRLEHMSRRAPTSASSDQGVIEDKDLDAANTDEMQRAQLSKLVGGKQQGEMVREDDLWQCLFGRPVAQDADKPDIEREVSRHLRAEAAEERRLTHR